MTPSYEKILKIITIMKMQFKTTMKSIYTNKKIDSVGCIYIFVHTHTYIGIYVYMMITIKAKRGCQLEREHGRAWGRKGRGETDLILLQLKIYFRKKSEDM